MIYIEFIWLYRIIQLNCIFSILNGAFWRMSDKFDNILDFSFRFHDSECFENILESFDIFGSRFFLVLLNIYLLFLRVLTGAETINLIKSVNSVKPLQCCNKILLA